MQATIAFGAVIFCRADRGDIKTLDDLRGKSFMGVNRNGWRVSNGLAGTPSA